MLTLQALMYIEGMAEPVGPFGTMPQEPWKGCLTRLHYPTQLWGSQYTSKNFNK